jgi:molybdenum cofactor guanylyltransferase
MISDIELATSPPMVGVILAGGQSRRMGGIDKALLPWRGRTLLSALIEQLDTKVQRLEINSNRPREHYAEHGFEVFADDAEVFDMGPLAGLLTALRRHPQALLLTVPCDAPILPKGYVERMCAAVQQQLQPLAVAFDGDDIHPTLCLAAGGHAASLAAFLASGQRRARDWLMQQQAVRVDFSDQPESFININHPSDLAMLNTKALFEEEV